MISFRHNPEKMTYSYLRNGRPSIETGFVTSTRAVHLSATGQAESALGAGWNVKNGGEESGSVKVVISFQFLSYWNRNSFKT